MIPAYEPDNQLIPLSKALTEAGFEVVVVDDGSGPKYWEIFDAVSPYAHIVRHEVNRGKGAALKTGMAYIRDSLPHCQHFITCDADGQHRVEDVIRVQNQLQAGHKFVLTMREQREDHIPLRSKVGNAMSRVVYALLTKRYLADNQSGLRGFDCSYIEWLVQVEKDNYDYEMNVLYYAAKKAIAIRTIPIEAIYIDNNKSSHFHPVKDTLRIYRSLFKLACGLFIGFGVAQMWMIAATIIFGYRQLLFSVPTAGVLAFAAHMITDYCFMFPDTKCKDQWTLLIHQIISYFLYTLGVMVFAFAMPMVPLWLAFNIVFFVAIPLRYWLHKFTFISLRTYE